MERLHTTPLREYSTYRCPRCGRQIRVLADEYGDHPCICGWAPYDDDYGYPGLDDEEEGD